MHMKSRQYMFDSLFIKLQWIDLLSHYFILLLFFLALRFTGLRNLKQLEGSLINSLKICILHFNIEFLPFSFGVKELSHKLKLLFNVC